ncbi:MAG: hypothetical protein A2X09_12590 [Bacteroidetes bacterium GWF2_43_11]|nr:MAG: hypothetical protein A2X09_12590 [Bacteroidetes bacterium GWF2_43_11]
MNEGYTLEWMDTLITVTLNPAKSKLSSIQEEDILNFRIQIKTERDKVMSTIKSLVFSVESETKIAFGIKQFHSTLIALLDQAMRNKICNSKYPELKQILNELIRCISELLAFIEGRFIDFLNINGNVPTAYLNIIKKGLLKRIEAISERVHIDFQLQPSFEIMIQSLVNFLNYSPEEHSFTFQEIRYIKELCREFEHIEITENTKAFSQIDELLISWNFNDVSYIANLTERLSQLVSSHKKAGDRIENLLYYFKLFKQLHKKQSVVFNSKYANLNDEICNWFFQEILYLEKKMRLSSIPLQEPVELTKSKANPEKPKQKVMCVLSTDQTGLILRATDELRILVAKSMNEVFKTIVPHLSTPYKEDLSFDGMRSKSYVAEDRDKQIAIETLERIIKKIKQY